MIEYEPKSSLNIRDFPKDLRNKFKAWCASNGVSMTEKIRELISEFLQKENNSNGRARQKDDSGSP
jgi:plasmid stability protein